MKYFHSNQYCDEAARRTMVLNQTVVNLASTKELLRKLRAVTVTQIDHSDSRSCRSNPMIQILRSCYHPLGAVQLHRQPTPLFSGLVDLKHSLQPLQKEEACWDKMGACRPHPGTMDIIQIFHPQIKVSIIIELKLLMTNVDIIRSSVT